MKPAEAAKLAASDGTLWWGGKSAGRNKASTQPVLVRLTFGPRGVVDIEDAATGRNIERIRTGTPFFAAPSSTTRPTPPTDRPAASEDTAPTRGREPADAAPSTIPGASAEHRPGPDSTAFRVSARATDAGRRWAVVDRANGDAVWIRHQGEEPFEAVFADKDDAERLVGSLALAPEMRVPAPEQALATRGAAAGQPGSALAAVQGKVIAKESRGTAQLIKVQVGQGTGARVFVAWDPVGGHQVGPGQSVFLSGTLGAEVHFNGRVETPVEGGTVEGEEVAFDRLHRTQPAPQGWIAADPGSQPLEEGQRVRVLDPHHPAHAADGQGGQLYSTVTVELTDGTFYIGTTPDARTVDFTHDQVIAVPATGTPEQPEPQPAPAPDLATAPDAALDVPVPLLTRLRGPEFPYNRRVDRWTVAELEPRKDGTRVEVLLLKSGEWAQVTWVDPHNLRDERGHYHGLEDVLAWRYGTTLLTLLDRPERLPHPAATAPVLVQEPAPKPPLVSRAPQSMTRAELEARATALDQWLNTYAAGEDSGASVRAVEQRNALRAELTRRSRQQTDAAQLGGSPAFLKDLAALTLEAGRRWR